MYSQNGSLSESAPSYVLEASGCMVLELWRWSNEMLENIQCNHPNTQSLSKKSILN